MGGDHVSRHLVLRFRYFVGIEFRLQRGRAGARSEVGRDRGLAEHVGTPSVRFLFGPCQNVDYGVFSSQDRKFRLERIPGFENEGTNTAVHDETPNRHFRPEGRTLTGTSHVMTSYPICTR